MSLPPPSAGASVLITGASSGIGREIACVLAGRGYSLALVARRRERLDELAAQLGNEYSVTADVVPLDLSDSAARARLVKLLTREPLAGLVNSAGFGTSGLFHQLPLDRQREQIVVNALALAELTHSALPGMVERGAGAILNIGSIAGFQPVPGAAVYSASKAFVQTLSEAVHEELRGTGVSCTVLCPGPVATDWWEIAGESTPAGLLQVTTPREVAEAGVAAMINGQRRVVPGLLPKLVGLGGRLAPRRLLLPALRRANSTRR